MYLMKFTTTSMKFTLAKSLRPILVHPTITMINEFKPNLNLHTFLMFILYKWKLRTYSFMMKSIYSDVIPFILTIMQSVG